MVNSMSDEEFLTFFEKVKITFEPWEYHMWLTSIHYEKDVGGFFNIDADNPSLTSFFSEFNTAGFVRVEPVYEITRSPFISRWFRTLLYYTLPELFSSRSSIFIVEDLIGLFGNLLQGFSYSLNDYFKRHGKGKRVKYLWTSYPYMPALSLWQIELTDCVAPDCLDVKAHPDFQIDKVVERVLNAVCCYVLTYSQKSRTSAVHHNCNCLT
ncbi:MAG: hypothetical protein QIT35_gp26 [Methanophagales virus PBV299]|uniref:Uncharacterized protein n=1 Tax=Methanophagales virus PBV299 TaxID=2987730 RepID=A0ABY6GLD9_9CAUD|nr:MAG: hypothetical protein QIT35_gp26 [Methanophagales virus PBV299]UYL64822.1 MAG: hypothetical protein OFDIEDLO_00026 [Methanophagales virus PBV299]